MSDAMPDTHRLRPDVAHSPRWLTLATLESECLTAVALAWFAVVLLLVGPELVTQDTWLSLVSGREIVDHGIPHVDTLAVLTSGRTWVDQQWLSHLALYGAWRAGGAGGVYALQVIVLTATAAAAIVAARKLGGSMRAVALAVPTGLLTAPWGWNIRGQAFGYVLFVLVLWLLARQSREPDLRCLLVLPLLIVWANLHGSVLIGAGLTVLWSLLTLACRRLPRRSMVVVFVAGFAAAASPLASPYGTSLFGYYHRLLIDPPFAGLILEWKRTTFSPQTALFWLSIVAVIAGVGLKRRLFTAFELITIVVLAAMAIYVIRNVIWFALAAAVLVPRALDDIAPRLGSRRGGRYDRRILGFALGTVALIAVYGSWSFSHRYEELWPSGAPRTVEQLTAGRPRARVYATERLADWLLWNDRLLRGRLVYDARVELLKRGEVDRIVDFQSGLRVASSPASGSSVVVFSADDSAAIMRLLEGGTFRIVSRDTRAVVLARLSPGRRQPGVRPSTA